MTPDTRHPAPTPLEVARYTAIKATEAAERAYEEHNRTGYPPAMVCLVLRDAAEEALGAYGAEIVAARLAEATQ